MPKSGAMYTLVLCKPLIALVWRIDGLGSLDDYSGSRFGLAFYVVGRYPASYIFERNLSTSYVTAIKL